MRDITDITKVQEALKRSEKDYRGLFESAHDAILIIEPKNKIILEANKMACELYGFRKSEFIGMSLTTMTEDLEALQENISRTLDKGFGHSYQAVHRHRSRRKMTIEIKTSVIKYQGIKAVLSINRDVTKLNHYMQMLEESESRYRLLFNSGNDSIFVHLFDENDQPSYFVEVNDLMSNTLGYSRDELLRMTPRDIDVHLSKQEAEEVLTALNSKKIHIFKSRHTTKSGNTIPVEINAMLIDYKGQKALMAISRDITDRVNYEQQLILAKEKAEKADQLKSIILANMSHEFRTPLNMIINYAGLLKDMVDDDLMKEYIDTILASGRRLHNTLTMMLQLSVIEADRTKLALSNYSIDTVFSEALYYIKREAEEKNLYIKEINNVNNCDVYIDETYFKEMLRQILDNAIKFTVSGGITITVSEENDSTGCFIILDISDTGVGIKKESMPTIFEAFRQGSEGCARVSEGSGLGLTLAKKIVELFNGTINIKSEEQKGTSVIIRIPAVLKK